MGSLAVIDARGDSFGEANFEFAMYLYKGHVGQSRQWVLFFFRAEIQVATQGIFLGWEGSGLEPASRGACLLGSVLRPTLPDAASVGVRVSGRVGARVPGSVGPRLS